MRLILAIVVVLLAGAVQVSAEPTTIGFADLPDPVARDFVDPYREMGAERLEDLRTIVRLDERLAAGDTLVPETRQRLAARRDAARQKLVASGFDIAKLLAQRWAVADRRKQALIATNPALNGAEVTIAGFLIPSGGGADGRATGYLVPQVGMCSHMATPPPNELVRLYFDPSMFVESMYLPVRVSGTLRTQANDETIHLLDGQVRMVSLWRLDAQSLAVEGPAVASDASSQPYDPLPPEDRRAHGRNHLISPQRE